VCLLCGDLWREEHWAEVAEEGEPGAGGGVIAFERQAERWGRRLRARGERARLVGVVLAGYGLSLQDWEGDAYILRDAKGSAAVVHDLAALWGEAERMIGRPLDPLDEGLVENLRARARPGLGPG
jgi:hypothetical protein